MQCQLCDKEESVKDEDGEEMKDYGFWVCDKCAHTTLVGMITQNVAWRNIDTQGFTVAR